MLTDIALKKLKPKDKIYKVADRDGMYATVSPAGQISFRYDYRMNGRRETVTLGVSFREVVHSDRTEETGV
ncbi:Arm DNA-binding domain-containing protein, partial [Mesorhizobium sp.]|uniref:Arm DNA-binding domain-containing protein n=1 Tax=Mesorhizobium sp. TaxID=1871066 RepID=UPI0012208389